METLFRGQKLSFSVPDAFNHENQQRNFILITADDSNYSLMYADNDCTCKDGWIKFENKLKYPVTKESIINLLKEFYGNSFKEDTLIIKE